MIEFRFALRPLDDIVPWGGDEPVLHWFGLTDGSYGVEVDGHELLRPAHAADAADLPVDYAVARLREDVLELAPAVLEPVPADLRRFVASEPAGWADDASDDDPPGDGAATAAALWHGEHQLDLGYLRQPPRLRFWRTVDDGRDDVCVQWRHGDGEVGATVPSAARTTVPTAAFVDAVRALDHALTDAMGRRVDELTRRGGLPGVRIDLAELRREHGERVRRPPVATLGDDRGTRWDLVRAGARRLLGDPHAGGCSEG